MVGIDYVTRTYAGEIVCKEVGIWLELGGSYSLCYLLSCVFYAKMTEEVASTPLKYDIITVINRTESYMSLYFAWLQP